MLAVQFIGQELLAHEIACIVVSVLVSFAVTQFFHQGCGGIAEVEGHRLVARLLHGLHGIIDGHIGRVALGTCCQIDGRFCKRNASFGPP